MINQSFSERNLRDKFETDFVKIKWHESFWIVKFDFFISQYEDLVRMFENYDISKYFCIPE